MLRKELKIYGIVKSSYDNKITLLFIDEPQNTYDTKFKLNKYHSANQINPIKYQEYYVILNNKSKIFLDKVGIVAANISELIDRTVEMHVYIKHYNFTNHYGKKIMGWNINLISMKPII